MKFERQFNRTRGTIVSISKRYSKATNIPKEEFESALCEEFLKKYERYDGRITFSAYIKPILTQCAKRVAERKERKFYEKIVHVDGILQDEGEPGFEFISDINIEREVIEPQKKHEDKLQLIYALVDSADKETTAIVHRLLETDPNTSLNSIATEMGIHHMKFQRKLKRLAKNYDQSRFGDVAQYLAV